MAKRPRGWGNRFSKVYEIEPELLWALYWGEELSTLKIAELFGCDASNIGLKMKEYGIPTRDAFSNHTRIKIQKDELEKLYILKNMTISSIAKIYNCSAERVGNALKTYGIKIKGRDKYTPWNKGKSKRPFKLSILRESKRYKDFRLKVFKRDRYTCKLCHQKSRVLNAHHIKPFATYPEGRYDINNAITLCYDCHFWVHHMNPLNQQ